MVEEAISRIQAHVLQERGFPSGEYQSFASRVECLFTNPVVAALDEYGIPMQLGEKVQGLLGTTNDLDQALANLSRIDATAVRNISSFERHLIVDAQDGL